MFDEPSSFVNDKSETDIFDENGLQTRSKERPKSRLSIALENSSSSSEENEPENYLTKYIRENSDSDDKKLY